MFVFIGVSLIFFQGGCRQLIKRVGERRTALFGVCSTLPGFLIIGNATSTEMLYGGLLLMTSGSGMTMPSLNSLVSRYTPADRQGLSLGVFRSLGSLSRAIGPVMGGLLYWKFGSSMPYWVGAAFLVVPFLWRLPPARAGERRRDCPTVSLGQAQPDWAWLSSSSAGAGRVRNTSVTGSMAGSSFPSVSPTCSLLTRSPLGLMERS
ncbi:MAG: hypothetical protein CM1200mP34_5410 [Verrucomicrobiales bacterium]|nr:MAG: hypothetical protein CM1200mP34_5410 [Verrucomicrobiales bacterium]